jgi:hypothetical protein
MQGSHRFLVALPPVSVLLLCAKHLFVAAKNTTRRARPWRGFLRFVAWAVIISATDPPIAGGIDIDQVWQAR